MDSRSHQYHVEDVGRILLQAQTDLREIRKQVQPGSTSNPGEIDHVLQRAEADLRAKAELVLSGLVNNSMRVLPVVPLASNDMENGSGSQYSTSKKKSIQLSNRGENVEDLISEFGIPSVPHNKKQERLRQLRMPRRAAVRIVRQQKPQLHTLLPDINRNDPSAPLPELTEEDARAGVHELLNRGLIPKNLDLTSTFTHGNTMLRNRPMRMHFKNSMTSVPKKHAAMATSYNIANLRFDMDELSSQPKKEDSQSKTTHENMMQTQAHRINIDLDGSRPEVDSESRCEDADDLSLQEVRNNLDSIRGYNELLDTYSLHQFIIRKGETLRDTPEFNSFYRTNIDYWGPISVAIDALETMLGIYLIPIAYIDGQQLVKLAMDDFEHLTTDMLLQCILNADHVSSLVKKPGQKFKGSDGKEYAAILIQSVARMYLAKRKFSSNCKLAESARYIQSTWKVFHGYRTLQKSLGSIRATREGRWLELNREFKERWDQIKTRRRVVVHIPSISIDSRSRICMDNFNARQNMQMARLCAVADPLVDIVYVTPFSLTDEVKGYYMKLMELGGISEPESRIRLLNPENSSRFPGHYSLSSVILYSPNCLRRIRRAIRGKEAYMVMGTMGAEDKRLAITLNIPILGLDPAMSGLYSSKSGSKRIFAEADVNIPVGAYDIYTKGELIETLARLIVASMHVKRWLIKVDNDFEGRGLAFVDVDKVPVVETLRTEKSKMEKKDARYWQDDSILEDAKSRLQADLAINLARIVVVCDDRHNNNWGEFISHINKIGCVIEEYPQDSKGLVRANLFIEPTGVVHVASTHERIVNKSNEFEVIGSVYPQELIPYEALRGASTAIGSVMYNKGLTGYMSIDYVTFIDRRHHNRQRIWALDILPHVTDAAMSFVFFSFLSRGRYHTRTGRYLVEGPEKRELKDESLIGQFPGSERSYFALEYILHPNLASMQYASFFNSCRLNGVCYDIQNSIGTTFILSDSLCSGVLGILSIGRCRKETIRYISASTDLINKEVGTRSITDSIDRAVIRGNFNGILSTIRALRKTKVN